MRAFAALSVVLYHAFPTTLRGGFIGVDVFYVISGFLISTIIYANFETGTFRFMEFYARRIKRIFPALLLVLLCCLVFGWYSLLSDEYQQLGKHILSGAAFVSNLTLWGESGYFDNAAESKPLLHLWSLGVEEQFYIGWPLLVWAAWRSRIGLLFVTLTVLLLSFLLNVHDVSRDAVEAFYSPLTRFWEISVGSLLAYLTLHRRIDVQRASVLCSTLISATGFVLLIAAVLFINQDDPFPGWYALVPVSGAALILAAGDRALPNRWILSSRLAVWFGLISYPLYLWHWPILSFGRIIETQTPARTFRIAAVALTILLAWVTYRFFERGVRSSSGFKAAGLLLLCNIALGAAGYYVYAAAGLPQRAAVRHSGFTPAVRRQFMGALWPYTQNDVCLNRYPYKDARKLAWWFCMQSDPREPTLVLLGDSFANELYPGFVNNRLLKHQTVLSIGTCDFGGRDDGNSNPNSPCYGPRMADQERFIDALIVAHPSIKFVVIDGLNREPDSAYIENVRRRIEFLQSRGILIVVFMPHLMPGFHPKACFTTPLRSVARDCTFSPTERTALDERFKPLVTEISRTVPAVRFFEQNDIYCRAGRCAFVSDGLPLHRDEVHISEYASLRLQEYFTPWAQKNLPSIFDPAAIGR